MRTIWTAEGATGFYSGWLPTVSRNVPFVVCTFSTFSALQQRRLQHTGERSLSTSESLSIGVLSALAAALITQPFDVVKTRMMTQAATSAAPYKSVTDCVATMWRTEGPAVFYSGLRQRSLYSGPLWAMQFALNEQFASFLLARKLHAEREMAR